MRYMSLCSGIESVTVAWNPLGWQPVAFAEIEKFPCAVLKHHYPDVPNLGDIAKIDGRKYRGSVDLVVGGTPCQGFSVAGKRGGMADARSGLAREFVRLVGEVLPRWIVWENVPGAFSTNNGRDFGAFVRALDDCGYGISWRVLDAQFFGVPQRRRRIFLVGHSGDWRPAAAVLFEPESLRGNSAPRQKARADVAGSIESSLGGRGANSGGVDISGFLQVTQALTGRLGAGGPDDNKAQGGFYVPDIASQAMSSKWSKGTSGPAGDEHHNLVIAPTVCGGPPYSRTGNDRTEADALVVTPPLTHKNYGDNASREGSLVLSFHGSQDPDVSGDVTHPLGRNQGQEVCVMAFTQNQCGDVLTGDIAPAIGTNANATGRNTAKIFGAGVRRLTVTECERLQGFSDDYTNIPGASDSARYRALGNSIAIPVMRWIGERVETYEHHRGNT
jgi:DNA (cytosine-5)-methyltransferase 1